MIIEYEKGNLKEMNQTGIKIIDFYAEWCGPCKMMASVFADIIQSNPNITIIKVNVDNNQNIAATYGVMSIPTVYIYKDNQEINKFVGFIDKNSIEAMIKS